MSTEKGSEMNKVAATFAQHVITNALGGLNHNVVLDYGRIDYMLNQVRCGDAQGFVCQDGTFAVLYCWNGSFQVITENREQRSDAK